MKIKKIILSLITVLCITTFLEPIISTVEAKVTVTQDEGYKNYYVEEETNEKITATQEATEMSMYKLEKEEFVQFLSKCIRWIVIKFMNVVAVVFSLCGVTEGTNIYFPQVGDIVYNTLPFFDPNFISPTKGTGSDYTLIQVISGIVATLYYTGITLATSAFVIISMAIGIKLVLSVSPEKKAMYKKAIVDWIIGVSLLLAGHLLISLIFSVNERTVTALYNNANNMDLKVFITVMTEETKDEVMDSKSVLNFRDSLFDKVFSIASEMTQIRWVYNLILGGVENAAKEKIDKVVLKPIVENGYQGIMDSHLVRASYGDIVSTLIMAVVAGQTLTIALYYLKRLFYCVILGILYPFVIITDAVNRITGKKTDLLRKWILQFSATVFIQTIHAFVYLFSCYLLMNVYLVGNGTIKGSQIISKYSNYTITAGQKQVPVAVDTSVVDPNENYLCITNFAIDDETLKATNKAINMSGLIAILQICVIGSFTRIDEVLKKFLGLGENPVGSLKAAGNQTTASFAFMYGAAKSLGDNVSGTVGGVKKVARYNKQIRKQDDKIKRIKGDTLEDGIPIVETPSIPSPEVSSNATTTEKNIEKNTAQVAQATQITPADVAGAAFEGSGKSNNEINNITNRLDKIYDQLQNNKGYISKANVENGTNNISNENNTNSVSNENITSQEVEVPNAPQVRTPKYNKNLEKALDKKSDLQAMRNDAIGQVGAKSTALMATLPLAIAGTAIGTGAESEKLGASVIMAGDKIAEAVGKMAVKTPMVTITETEKIVNKVIEKKDKRNKAESKNENIDDK